YFRPEALAKKYMSMTERSGPLLYRYAGAAFLATFSYGDEVCSVAGVMRAGVVARHCHRSRRRGVR
ncbi:TPA: hypothetical protein ACXZU9_004708, partial [Salmonella enterica]